MQNGDKFKRKASVKKRLPQESRKRKVEHKRYSEQVSEFRIESKENGNYKCYFCGGDEGKEMDKWLCVHHLEGREGNYINKETFVWVHNYCHNIWHFASMEELKEQEWYNEEFLTRLKAKSIVAYSKQKRKEEKSEELFGDVEN